MAKTPTYRMKSRMIVVLVGMVVFGFCVVLHQLFKLQVLEADFYQERALGQQLRSEPISPQRGTIYDTSGQKALARSATVWTVVVNPAQIKGSTDESTERRMITVLDCLNAVLGLDRESTRQKIENNWNLQYLPVKTKVEKPQADELMEFVSENGVPGISLEEDTMRYYPYGNFLSSVLGFTNSDGRGAYGLESYYESVLGGTPGRVVSLKDSRGVDMDEQYSQLYEPQDGNSLVLTIDETIQHYLEKNLEIAVDEHKIRNRAVGIVMDVNTGAILAMAVKPDFDPNNPQQILDESVLAGLEELKLQPGGQEAYAEALQQAQLDQWRNKAISDSYEPGSVFKIVTASGALESGAVTAQSTFNCIGYTVVNGTSYQCWYWSGHQSGHGVQTLEQAVMNSCNPAFIDIGQREGAKTFASYFDNFGLTSETGIDLPGEGGSIYHATYTVNDLASSSFGQTFKVTPIQMITAASAAVNGGYLMQPYIVKQVIDPNGDVVSTTEPVVKRQVISEEISEQMRGMLEMVVKEGSGKQAGVPGYRIGGKTGTSEQLDNYTAIDDENRMAYTLSFFGFAPADDPQIACLVLMDDPDIYNPYGSTVAAPVVGQIFADVLPYLGIEPEYTEEESGGGTIYTPNVSSPSMDLHEAQYTIRNAGLKFRVVGNGTQVLRQMPGVAEPISKGGVVVLYTEEAATEEAITVPDVMGMTASEANDAIVGLGLNIAMTGDAIDDAYCVVTNQLPVAGEQVPVGSTVTVALTQQDPPEEAG